MTDRRVNISAETLDEAKKMVDQMAAFEAIAAAAGWSEIRRDLEMRRYVWPSDNKTLDFLLDYGREYAFSEKSFEGDRGTPKECYTNATHLALENPELTYVEGKAYIFGIAIDHAWCVDGRGNVIDPTLAIDDGKYGGIDRIGGYFGVPFRTDYLHKAIVWNNVYGLLDYFTAPLTVPKLAELGLDAGQQWLLDQKKRPPRKRKRAKR